MLQRVCTSLEGKSGKERTDISARMNNVGMSMNIVI